MFKRQTNRSSNLTAATIIGSGVELIGTLNDDGPITVFGHCKGEINSQDLVVIGEGAKIEGPISAKNVTVSGDIMGGVIAKETLEIGQYGQLDGTIEAGNLIIQPGAIFNGQCKMEKLLEEKIEPDEDNKENKSKYDYGLKDKKIDYNETLKEEENSFQKEEKSFPEE